MDIDGKPIILQIWDTAGQESFQSLGPTFYSGIDCCVLIYGATKPESFESIKNPHDIEDHFYEPIDNSSKYKDPELTIVKSEQKTSFYLAIEKGNLEIIHLFLKNQNIDFNIVNTTKTETNEYYENFRRYQNGNIYRWSVKTTKKDEKTAFYLAVEKENLEIIQHLLSLEKVDINIPCTSEKNINSDKDECSFGNTDSELEETVETEIKTALYFLVENEKLDILKLLLTNDKIDVNLPCKYNESYNLGSYNSQRKEDQCQEEKTPFYLAVEYKNIEMIKILLSNSKIDINKENVKTTLSKKYKKDEEDEVKSSESLKINRTPLHLAVKNQSIEIIKILLNQKDIDLNIKNDEGLKPIELAKNKKIKNLFNQ